MSCCCSTQQPLRRSSQGKSKRLSSIRYGGGRTLLSVTSPKLAASHPSRASGPTISFVAKTRQRFRTIRPTGTKIETSLVGSLRRRTDTPVRHFPETSGIAPFESLRAYDFIRSENATAVSGDPANRDEDRNGSRRVATDRGCGLGQGRAA